MSLDTCVTHHPGCSAHGARRSNSALRSHGSSQACAISSRAQRPSRKCSAPTPLSMRRPVSLHHLLPPRVGPHTADDRLGALPYQWSKKTGAIAASAAPTCRARIGRACLGDCGTHLIAKNNTIGAWAAMRSCQMWAAAPSSAWGAVPCKATKISTVARAPRDIATGRKALGCFSMVNGCISPPYGLAVGHGARCHHKALCVNEQPRGIARSSLGDAASRVCGVRTPPCAGVCGLTPIWADCIGRKTIIH
jgi:hypothetical protein